MTAIVTGGAGFLGSHLEDIEPKPMRRGMSRGSQKRARRAA